MNVKVTKNIEIVNRRGLHARAAALFVKHAEQYQSEILVAHGPHEVPGRSIMGLLLLSAGVGTSITITAEGNDAEAALEALTHLVQSKFFEEA
ncbi:MAG: HPr family phosphocarrier protein [Candidatus Nucleicultricaceae bacterium]